MNKRGVSAQVKAASLSGSVKQAGYSQVLKTVPSDAYLCSDCAGEPSELSPIDRENMRLTCAKRQYLSATKNVQALISDINPSVFDMVNIDAIQDFDRQNDERRLQVASKDFNKEMDHKRLTMLYNSITDCHMKIGRMETTLRRIVERDMRICAENARLRDSVSFWRNSCDEAKVNKTNMACQVADLMLERQKLQKELQKEKQVNQLRKGTGIVPKRLVRYQRMNGRPVSWTTPNN